MKSFGELKIKHKEKLLKELLPVMNLGEKLKDKEERLKEEKARSRANEEKRYVIGCDPFDLDTQESREKGINVFTVYDKNVLGYTAKIRTKKGFKEFIADLLDKSVHKSQYIVSHKFITNEGRTCSLQEARVRVESYKGLDPTF